MAALTPPPRFLRSRFFSLRLVMSALITLLLLGLGLGIIFYTFSQARKNALVTTGNIFELNAQQIEEKLAFTIDTVTSFVAVSSTLKNLGVQEMEGLKTLLPYFRQSFTSIPWMSAVYVGYDNGDFYIIQALRDNGSARETLSAPEQAAYMVKRIVHGPQGRILEEYLFHDANLGLVAERRVEFDGYDPRRRGWYNDAAASRDAVVTRPYIFFSTRQIGVSIANRLADGNGVVGADAILEELKALLQGQRLTPHSEIALVDRNGTIILSSNDEVLRCQQANQQDLKLQDPVVPAILQAMFRRTWETESRPAVLNVAGAQWFGHVRPLLGRKNQEFFLLTASPMDELMVDARAVRQQNMLILTMAMGTAIGVGLLFARRLTVSLQHLSKQAEGIRDFRLSDPLTVPSAIREVHSLAADMSAMQSAINRFVEIARALSAEKRMEQVLEMIVTEAQAVTSADGGGIGLVSDDGRSFQYVLARNTRSGVHRGGMGVEMTGETAVSLAPVAGLESIEHLVVSGGKTFTSDDLEDQDGLDVSRILALHADGSNQTQDHGEAGPYRCRSLLCIPLLNRHSEVIGVLHLVNARDGASGAIVPFSSHRISYVEALSSNAALALDNNRLLRAQKELFDSFVRLLAGAIDTKSPYTGGHCQRVPVIAGMLAEAASRDKAPPFAGFALTEDERYALFVASWLHDCGKVTTPEYVVDKATKLETIYNRIHEIRTRFEVLWRDAELAFWSDLTARPEEEGALRERLALRQQQLREDFAFIAACNQGGEFMDPDRVERLQVIGGQTWQRHFDNRLGLSGDEEQRLDPKEETSLPAVETLLADRREHIIPRSGNGDPAHPYGDNPFKFNMEAPHDGYNLGELYNLSISRGTLTSEERYKINDHIVQTIIMLNRLPFPREIRQVPDWAGNHHETLDGTGYPRGLSAGDLSIPERIMAVADIFEALTAADRPYKPPRLLSDCIRLMAGMRDSGHICPDLFALLLRSGIYRQYAARYMRPEQIDEVDIAQFLPDTRH
jgi:HD-GYP domain-containing protein (c-di-GMP phosphodiesterase class II)